jgi:hypothetical protein
MRRTRLLHLTRHGKEVLGKATRLGAEWDRTICAGLSTAEREQLLALLQRVAVNIGVADGELPDQETGQRPDPLTADAPHASGRRDADPRGRRPSPSIASSKSNRTGLDAGPSERPSAIRSTSSSTTTAGRRARARLVTAPTATRDRPVRTRRV